MPEWSLNASRPQDFGRIADWFGVWLMYEPAAAALFETLQRCNLRLHVQEALAAAPISSNTGLPLYRLDNDIAVIGLSGPMMKASSSFGGASTVEARQALRSARADGAVKAAMLHIDSPGGTVAGTGDLAADVAEFGLSKPIWTYFEDLGASAAYQVGAQGGRIFVNPSGAVGSIGVYSVVRDLSGMAEEMRVKVHVIRAGEFKGAGTPGTVVTDAQLAEFQRTVDAYYARFLDSVAMGRKMDRAKVEALGDGRVHIGEEAVALGLADQVGSFEFAMSELRQFAARRVSVPVKGSKAMSDPTLTSAATTPVPATLAELRELCDGAHSDFLLAQLDAKATGPQALKAFCKQLQTDLKASQTALAAEQLKVKELTERAAAAPTKVLGSKPITGGKAETENTVSATDTWNDKLQALVDAGKTRAQATTMLAAKFPELREQMVAEANANRGQKAA